MNNEVENRVYLYGLNDEYHVVRYTYIHGTELTIKNLMFQAMFLKSSFRGITSVYAVDNSYGVYSACRDVLKTNSLENRVLFKIMLETNGIRMV